MLLLNGSISCFFLAEVGEGKRGVGMGRRKEGEGRVMLKGEEKVRDGGGGGR